MAFELRSNEELIKEVNFHWSAFIAVKLWAAFGVFLEILFLIGLLTNEKTDLGGSSSTMIWTGIIFFTPFAYKWIENNCKTYIVTNQRVYVEYGILAKTKNDLPLSKINDVNLKQSFVQRVLGSGDLILLTGDSIPTLIKDIDSPDEFKNAISEMTNSSAA